MEENLAIMMADLTGYTALTERHGAVAAADLIDKYMRIAENCLVGDSKIHERVGDEIMIVSASPDALLATAQMIGHYTAMEEHFLQLHGGLHYGKVIKRGNSYFGTAVNLTSRIAAKANAGTFWFSSDYLNVLSDRSFFTMQSKGKHGFKNISQEKEVFELGIENKNTFYIDPICSMLLLNPRNAIAHPTMESHYFCSSKCLDLYSATGH